jgi:hypothetical protein
LVVGNLSRRKGGDITSSVSHNSGRDVDLAFYTVRKNGTSVMPGRYYHYDSLGRAGALRFDIVRNWELVRALLLDKSIQVQHLFIYQPLADLLIDYANSSTEPRWLVERAKVVLKQPMNSSPHDDHFHVRLYCSRDDRLLGCLNTGPIHGWIDDYSDEVTRFSQRLAKEFTNNDIDVAVSAIKRVGIIRGEAAIEALAKALNDPRTEVRREATTALGLLERAHPAVPELVRHAEKSSDPIWVHDLLTALAAIRDVAGAPSLMAAMSASANTRPETWIVAAHGLASMLHVEAVPTLVDALLHSDARVRSAASLALLRITNHRFGSPRAAHRKWLRWWGKNKHRSRIEWVRSGFARRGLLFKPKNSRRSLLRLVELIRQGGPYGFNARAYIRDISGFFVERHHFNDLQLYRLYQTWLRVGSPKMIDQG